jgi:hypothetical protein
LFGETMEPQAYRLVVTETPLGLLTGGIPSAASVGNLVTLETPRFTHKSLVVNKTVSAIEFPFVPYFPMFLPDGSIGQEPEGDRVPITEDSGIGPISTLWAWREQEKSIQRGTSGAGVLGGITLTSPEYFIDNRRLEVRLRPDEGNYSLVWVPPRYDFAGSLTQNATLRLGNDGPAREIIIDFENRIFEIASQPDTVYDLSNELGEGAFPCINDTPSDNLQLAAVCSCIVDVTDSDLKDSSQLPARFMHLDELASAGFGALYVDDVLQTPFTVDLERTTNSDPCCQCLYYIRGIFFKLDGSNLPTIKSVDPAYSSAVTARYAWSRVPHGISSGDAVDGGFNAFEGTSDNLTLFNGGEVFRTRIPTTQTSLDFLSDGGAVFPSRVHALNKAAADEGITVIGPHEAGDPRLHGGVSASDDGESRGEEETIVLTLTFDTYVRITRVDTTFYAGVGFAAPQYQLRVVPPGQRTADLITNNVGIVVGEASTSALNASIPGSNTSNDLDVANGNVKFISRILPVYAGLPFWESYGMEWQLIFPARSSGSSMGIASIVVTLDALAQGSENTETVGIRERKYYRSTGIITGNLNPERFLGEQDGATAYWRTTESPPLRGDNRHRAYAWGEQIEDNQNRIASSDIKVLEKIQEEEYDTARSLFNTPYQFRFNSFIPLDEQNWLELLGEDAPTWSLTMTSDISSVEGVTRQSNQLPFYGVIPERQNFNAPGHAWVHNFEDSYAPCCFGCVHSQLVNYDFIHLHDGLALVETANFWTELPSGFTRLIRSTIMLPDPTFQGGAAGVGDVVLFDESQFVDSNGEPIPLDILTAAGFNRDAEGNIYVDSSQPDSGVGGPTGPAPGCGN